MSMQTLSSSGNERERESEKQQSAGDGMCGDGMCKREYTRWDVSSRHLDRTVALFTDYTMLLVRPKDLTPV